MKCIKISELIMEYIDGHLDKTAASEVESHISQCESCKFEYELSKKAIDALSSKKLILQPPDMLSSVLEKTQKKPWLVMNKMTLAWSGVAVFALIVSFGIFDSLKTPSGQVDKNPTVMARSESKRDMQQAPITIIEKPQGQKTAPSKKTIQQPKQKIQQTPKPKRKYFVRQYFASSNKKPASYIMVFVPDSFSESEVTDDTAPVIRDESYKMDSAKPGMAAPAPAALSAEKDNADKSTTVFDSSYSIKMTNHGTGETTSIDVKREVKPDNEIKNTIKMDVNKQNSKVPERSYYNENNYNNALPFSDYIIG